VGVKDREFIFKDKPWNVGLVFQAEGDKAVK
jgi:hypothetical protein